MTITLQYRTGEETEEVVRFTSDHLGSEAFRAWKFLPGFKPEVKKSLLDSAITDYSAIASGAGRGRPRPFREDARSLVIWLREHRDALEAEEGTIITVS